ncbi:hypothetical protein HG537_0D05640 [Torulaspora globosa]|uniref:JmjC domain-containing histone demethylation protein 1 n=1 Tax=Torulaspora globosa TaxID=48254 RepID=A0A7H9HTK3_9SACH|nr:hypothetical protein HG537_0D05640 [Torulaspora sp. CBS 2947]
MLGKTSMDTCNYCQSSSPLETLWVQCDLCDQWVHVSCVPFKCIHYEPSKIPQQQVLEYPKVSKDIAGFHCSKHGSEGKLYIKAAETKRRRSNDDQKTLNSPKKRYSLRTKQQIDYIALNEGEDVKLKHVHPHADAFLDCFKRWENTTNFITAKDFYDKFLSLREPLKIIDPHNSGMKTPKSSEGQPLTVEEISFILGDDYPVDVMDIQTQQNERWTMSRWNQYLTHTKPETRDRVRNVISLEVSHIKDLNIERPIAVEENDLVNVIWKSMGNGDEKPKVTRYVLMSAGNSYTDFHLDFAGTSVYYNLISGNKKFILFPPTQSNLKKYADWCCDINQNAIFLGDLLTDGIAMELLAGDLFMIPSGFIHAVYTPVDSLIIGGNFLTVRDIETQLKVVQLERMTKVPKRFTFPNFDLVMGKCCEWFASPTTETDQETDRNLKDSISSNTLHALIQYMQDPTTKYKPIHYTSKRMLIKRLQKLNQLLGE